MMRLFQLSSRLVLRRTTSTAAAPQGVCPFQQPPPPPPPPKKKPAAKPKLFTDAGLEPRPFTDVPTPKGLPLIGTGFDLIRCGGAAKIHEYCDMRHKQLGPIYREVMGEFDMVCISKTEYIKKVYSSEGKYPEHFVPEAWIIYNKMRGITRGVFFMNGAHWRNIRAFLNQILSPRVAEQYVGVFNDVITDVVDRFGKLSQNSVDGAVPCLETELYNWSIETLVTMVFGRRLGCVAKDHERSEMHEFVQHIRQIFTETSTMAIVPAKVALSLNLPCWQRFVHAADRALEMARGYVLERIAEIEEAKKKGEHVDGILVQLLEVQNSNQDEIINIVADLILAAADTTSHATQWSLYLLSKHPEAQERIISDINAVVPPGEIINATHLRKLPYIQNVIKESLRMYPIASFLTRILPNDIVLGDYTIPEGKLIFMSQYTIGRDPEKFKDPLKFNPDRWLKQPPGVPTDDHHVCMPFGFGARSCIGRRVAELKMQLLIARTVQRYHMENLNKEEVGIHLRMVTTPDQPVKIRFTERNT